MRGEQLAHSDGQHLIQQDLHPLYTLHTVITSSKVMTLRTGDRPVKFVRISIRSRSLTIRSGGLPRSSFSFRSWRYAAFRSLYLPECTAPR